MTNLVKPEVEPEQHEQRAEGDQEARDSGLGDEPAVEDADHKLTPERQRHADERGSEPTWTARTDVTIAAVTTATPDDRSNSPPIINSATQTAITPMVAL